MRVLSYIVFLMLLACSLARAEPTEDQQRQAYERLRSEFWVTRRESFEQLSRWWQSHGREMDLSLLREAVTQAMSSPPIDDNHPLFFLRHVPVATYQAPESGFQGLLMQALRHDNTWIYGAATVAFQRLGLPNTERLKQIAEQAMDISNESVASRSRLLLDHWRHQQGLGETVQAAIERAIDRALANTQNRPLTERYAINLLWNHPGRMIRSNGEIQRTHGLVSSRMSVAFARRFLPIIVRSHLRAPDSRLELRTFALIEQIADREDLLPLLKAQLDSYVADFELLVRDLSQRSADPQVNESRHQQIRLTHLRLAVLTQAYHPRCDWSVFSG